MNLQSTPSDEGVADAVPGNWVDVYAPSQWRPYLRLARADRPIGVWLLLIPCWLSLALAEISRGAAYPSLWTMFLFAAGAFVMRGAGCAYNDFVDRDIDAQVERTRMRPIPSGQISATSALQFAVALSFVGLAVLLQFDWFTVGLGTASLLLVAVYPFMKRVTYWPQLVLGLAFNWGALMGWSSVYGSLGFAPILLYIGAVLWTIGYDTIYAHQDKDDDLMIGLKSTALRFGDDTKAWLAGLYGGAILVWAIAALVAGGHLLTFLTLAVMTLHFSWQVSTLETNDAQNCLTRFRSNRDVGLLFFGGLCADMLLSWLLTG